jgi:threonine aldolase
MTQQRGFASDNNASVHPAILQALAHVNQGHAIGYGGDPYTRKAIDRFKEEFGPNTEVFFVYNGTGANTIAIQALNRPFNAVICSELSHINMDECGAPEKQSGCKLLPCQTGNAKLTIEHIKQHLHSFGFEHHSQPGMVSITQATEMGTIYSLDEIQQIADFVHDKGLYLHMDGARLANAAATLNCSLWDTSIGAGVDVLSFGGTKNGLMFGEAVLFANPDLARQVKYIRKQTTQLHSKMRYVAAQFSTLLENELWRENALHANKMARLLKKQVEEIPEITITQKVQANGVFCQIPPQIIAELQNEFFFYVWDESNHEVRWMTSFDTQEEDVHQFIEVIKKHIKLQS